MQTILHYMETVESVDKTQTSQPELEESALKPRTRERKFINPYLTTIREFPGRIFLFENFEQDARELLALCSEKQVIVEAGCGSGQHLIARALENPTAVCFGLELRYKRCVRAVEKANDRGAENLYILRLDARLLSRVFAQQSIDELFVLFPDPWNKRRTQKHRLLNALFLTSCQSLLRPSGSLSVKTDHESYFTWFLEEVKHSSTFVVEQLSHDLHSSDFISQNIVTEFEEMFLAQQLPIQYAKLAPLPLT